MTTPALDTLRALLPLLARDEDRAVTGIFGGDTLNAIEAALALIGDDDADDAGLRHEVEKAQLRAEIDRLQSNLTASASAFAALEAVAAEARRNDAIAMSWISEAKHAIGYEGDMPGFIEALRALKADPWPTIARGMITPAHIAAPRAAAPLMPASLEASVRDTIARFAATDDLAKDAADAVLEIVRPLAERSDRLEAAESARRDDYQNWMTALDRNAELLAKLEAAEKERDELLAGLDEWLDKTKWVQQGVNEGMISAKYLGLHRADVMTSLLGEAEKERDALRAENAGLVDDMNLLRDNNTALRARIEEMEKQESVATVIKEGDSRYWMSERLWTFPDGKYPLYALPGAKGEEK